MHRGKIRDHLWWDDKTSIGKTPKQIVKAVGKELLFNENEIEMILIKFASLKEDQKFFKVGVSTTTAILVCTYLCANALMFGREPLSPWKFARICGKHHFDITKSILMKHVRKAKVARLFPRGPDCPKLIKKYRNRMAYKFHFEDKILDEIQERANKEGTTSKIGGKSPFVAAAGLTYVVARRHNLLVSQNQIANFFGISELSLRNFWLPFREEAKFKQNIS